MAWRDRLVRAAFKGVPFWVDAHVANKARRVGESKLAGRDGSAMADLGRDSDEYEITAYLFGPDYDLAREDLEETLASRGAGVLTLPTRGDRWVRITRGPSTTERQDEGGYCSIRFTATVEDREAGTLSRTPDTRAQLETATTEVQTRVHEDFAATVKTESLSDRYVSPTLAAVDGVARKLARAQRVLGGALSPISAAVTRVDDLRARGAILLGTPSRMATGVLDLVLSVYGGVEDHAVAIDRLTGLPEEVRTPFERGRAARLADQIAASFRGLGDDYGSQGQTPEARQSDLNTIAVYRLARTAALVGEANALSTATLDSARFALDALARMLAELDAIARMFGTTDALHVALRSLRASLARHLLGAASKLPDVRRHVAKRPVPALLIAYELYGDASMEADLVARNRTPAPLFTRGELEVLA